jgi:aerobic-type carbon monoxide dehydrogenase small subunit (CoxS/CutS family)
MPVSINGSLVELPVDPRVSLLEHDGVQCGYCTPGQIRSTDLSARTTAFNQDRLHERMSGNLCRRDAYNGIITAIAETCAGELRGRRSRIRGSSN